MACRIVRLWPPVGEARGIDVVVGILVSPARGSIRSVWRRGRVGLWIRRGRRGRRSVGDRSFRSGVAGTRSVARQRIILRAIAFRACCLRLCPLSLLILTDLDVVGALARRICLGGLDLIPGRLVSADLGAVHAAVHRVGRYQPTVVITRDVLLGVGVEAVSVRRFGRYADLSCRRTIYSVLSPRSRSIRLISDSPQACQILI